MSKSPPVTVLMSVYNCEQFIEEAIDSILKQTFKDFEFIIIEDASTDETLIKVKGYNDSRIKLVERSTNHGLTNNLNYGLSLAKGKYIARMDGDDISLPLRLEKQVEFMDTNEDVIVCGTNYIYMNHVHPRNPPNSHQEITLKLLAKNCMCHPSVMLRNNILKKNKLRYNSSFPVTQDYEFWTRLMNYGRLHNLPEVLLKYRKHQNQKSAKSRALKPALRAKIRVQMLNHLDMLFSSRDLNLLQKIFERYEILNKKELNHFFKLKNQMVLSNNNKIYPQDRFEDYLKSLEIQILKDFFLKRTTFTPDVFGEYVKVYNSNGFRLPLSDTLKLFVKSLIRFKSKSNS